MLNVNGLYRHFKGGFYIVKEIAQLESSPDEDNKWWFILPLKQERLG